MRHLAAKLIIVIITVVALKSQRGQRTLNRQT